MEVLNANHSKLFLTSISRLKAIVSQEPENAVCFLRALPGFPVAGSQKTAHEEGGCQPVFLGVDRADSLPAPRHGSSQLWHGPSATVPESFSSHLEPWQPLNWTSVSCSNYSYLCVGWADIP